MIDGDDTEKRIVKVILEYVGKQAEIDEKTTLEALDLDSLDTVELTMELEEEFDQRIYLAEEYKDWETVADIFKTVKEADELPW